MQKTDIRNIQSLLQKNSLVNLLPKEPRESSSTLKIEAMIQPVLSSINPINLNGHVLNSLSLQSMGLTRAEA